METSITNLWEFKNNIFIIQVKLCKDKRLKVEYIFAEEKKTSLGSIREQQKKIKERAISHSKIFLITF